MAKQKKQGSSSYLFAAGIVAVIGILFMFNAPAGSVENASAVSSPDVKETPAASDSSADPYEDQADSADSYEEADESKLKVPTLTTRFSTVHDIKNALLNLKERPHDREIQQNAMSGLIHMMENEGGVDNQKMIADMGGVGQAVTCMRNSMKKKKLHIGALSFLVHLAENEDNTKKIVEEGAIQQTIASMNAFPDDVGIQDLGSYTLYLVSFDLEAGEVLVKENGIKAIVNAMKTFEENPNVQEKTLMALKILAAKQAKTAAPQIIDEGGLEIAMQIVDTVTTKLEAERQAMQAKQGKKKRGQMYDWPEEGEKKKQADKTLGDVIMEEGCAVIVRTAAADSRAGDLVAEAKNKGLCSDFWK